MGFILRLVGICFLLVLLSGVVVATGNDPMTKECKNMVWKKYKSMQTEYYPPFVENVGSKDKGAQCSFKTIGGQKVIYHLNRAAAKSWAINTWASENILCDSDYYERELSKLSRWGYFLELVGWNTKYSNLITFYKKQSSEKLRIRSEEATRFAQEIAAASVAYTTKWNECMGIPS